MTTKGWGASKAGQKAQSENVKGTDAHRLKKAVESARKVPPPPTK